MTKLDATLTGHGRLPWEQIQDLTAGLTCAWADYGGFRIGGCPETAPPYTHLWAWDDAAERLVRVRIDGSQGVVGELVTTGGDVRVERTDAIPWPSDHHQVGPLPFDMAGWRLTLFTTLEPNPITFLHVEYHAD